MDKVDRIDAIAIIGIGCRFPGRANNPEAFWRLLRDGIDAISEIPAKRWDVDALYDPDVSIPGKTNTRWGGFLEEIDQFDPGFFGISHAEAGRIDPQQRSVLEVAWEALEDAGQVLERLAGSPTGVFIGVHSHDYSILQFSDVDSIVAHTSTGTSHSIIANRLSYALDLRGPSVAVDTACSSSLVATHLACQSLWNKECDLALAGGVNLIVTPVLNIAYSKLHMMAADGRCKSFDARGDGFVRGEGCGIVALKRLSDALSAGDPILALIRGSAINHGGNTNGLTAPNGLAQRALVRQALDKAGVLPSQISYVETHGTGTPLGDPIEVEALASVVGPPCPDGRPCVIGSVKTNIGHLESAAGIAGLIKVVLSMQHGAIPPNLHFKKLNPNISLENTRFVIPTELRPWPSEAGPRYAGVSSFGFGGANAHMILEEAPATETSPMLESPADQREKSYPVATALGSELQSSIGCRNRTGSGSDLVARGGACLLPLSARSAESLHSLSGSYLDLLSAEGSEHKVPMDDICYTASVWRSHHEHRLALVGHSREDLAAKLKSFRAGESSPGMSSGVLYQDRQLRLAFVFSGQGSQRFDMGRELMGKEPLFRQTLEECDELFRPQAGWSLLEELGKEESQSRLDQTEVSQPAIFAIQIALAALWRSWGIHPFAVVGHSVGEVAAAYVANILSLQDAVRVIFQRGRLMQQAAGRGKMLAAGLSCEEADRIQASNKESLSVAAINSPTSVVFSGEPAAVDHLFESLQRRKVFCRLLSGNYAFHSPQMAPFQGQLEKSLRGLKPQPASTRIFSTVTGQACDGRLFDALYWSRNIREPVRFATAMDDLLIHGCDLFLEIGAHPDLSVPISQCLKHRNRDGALFPSLVRGRNEMEVMLGSLGGLYTQGYPFDWKKLYPSGGRRVRLPSYAWQHEPFWLDAQEPARARSVAQTSNGSGCPLLGLHIKSAAPSETHFWEMEIGTKLFPYLKDHRVSELVLLPAAAYVEMALAAAVKAFGPGAHILEGLNFKRMLSLPEDGVQKVQLVISPEFPGTASFQFFSLEEQVRTASGSDRVATWDYPVATAQGSEPDLAGRVQRDGAWALNVSGTIRIGRSGPAPELAGCSPHEVQALCHESIAGDDHYEQMRHERDLYYGPSFQGVERVWRHDGEALARLRFTEEVSSRSDIYQIHPALLDACFQVLLTLPVGDAGTTTYLPIGLERLRLCGRPGSAVWAHARISKHPQLTNKTFEGDVSLLDESGNVLLEARGLLMQRLGTVSGETEQELNKLFYQLQWFPKAGLGHAKRLPPHYLPAPSLIAESARCKATSQPDVHHYDELTRRLDILSTSYVLRAFHQLGWQLRARQRVSLGHLGPHLGVVSQHRLLLGRMLEILEQEAIIKKSGFEWEVSSVRECENERDEIETLLSQYPECEAELTLVKRCGERLAEVLRGKCDPLQLLFPDGSLTTTEKLYRDSPFFSVACNHLIKEAIGRALEDLPDRRTVRILEIGAGTGGTTSYVLPRLPGNRTEYVFTDLSDLFTSAASRKFKDYPFVQYRLLDIERNLEEQGFAAAQFDIILAANVLHATKDLSDTLKHVQQLSAPGALLVLLELTEPQRWLDLVFGLTEGWWRFADNKLRPSHPLLSLPKWLDLLTGTGFTDAAVIPDKREDGRTLSRQSVIMARASQAQMVHSPWSMVHGPDMVQGPLGSMVQDPQGSWIVFADKEGVGQGLWEQFQSRGETCIVVLPGESYEFSTTGKCRINPEHPEDFERLVSDFLAAGQRPCRGVVHLWSLDCVSPDESTVKSLEPEHVSGCYSVLYLVQALARASWSKMPRLWLVTRGAQTIATEVEPVSLIQSPVWGLARVIAHEHLDLRCAAIDLDPAKPEYERDALFQELWSEDSENQLAMRGDTRYAARLVRYSTERAADHGLPGSTGSLPLPVLNQPFRLAIRTPGVLDTLTLQTTTPAAPGPGEVGIEVRASGLNFNDVMKAMHIYPGLPNGLLSLGCECAGKIISIGEGVEEFQLGDEVVAVTNHALGSHVVADARLVFHKLDRHSFEEAATISIVFLTAFHALHSLARLGKGERVLIHSAAGGVGLAAVQLAQRVGAEIFATAGNPERREFLRSLGIRYVFDSRSLAFADEVMEHTSGEGVDVVLNSLTGEAIPKGLSILRPYGRFLEIGKRDIYRNRQIGLNPFRNNLSYFAIDLDRMSRERPAYVGSQLREVMQQFTDGKFHPLPVRVFPVSEVIDAFRYMAQAKQIGKIAISLPQQNSEVTHAGVGRAEIRSDCTYLISGGIGGLGLEVAKWLVEHGARHLVLMGRRGVSATVQKALDAMKRTDGEVVVLQADVSQRQQIAAVLDRIRNSMPPLKGIIHAAGVLDDGILLQLNRERFAKVMAPKTEGAWNLHVLTRDLSLDFFVLFSSAVSLLGSPGQGNHTAANAFLDALAHYRRAQGRPCLSINWGPWSEIGAAAESNRAGRLMLGISSIRPEQGIEALEHLLRQDAAQAGVMVFEAQKWYQAHPTAIESPSLLHLAREQSNTDVSKPQKNNIRETLVVAQVGHRRSLLESHLREQISRVLKLPPSRIDPQKPLASMGLDSLMVLEVSNLLESSLKVPLSATVIWNYPTVAVLADHLAKKMGVPLESPVKYPAQEKSTNQFSELEGQQIANVLAALKNLSGEDLR